MDKEQLKKGIAILYDMELDNYFLVKSISTLNYWMSRLGHRQNFVKPIKRHIPYDGCEGDVKMLGVILGGVIGFVIAGFVCLGLYSSDADMWWAIVMVLLCVVGGIYAGRAIAKTTISVREAGLNNEELFRFMQANQTYQDTVAADEARVKRELIEKAILERERDRLVARKRSVDQHLKTLYDKINIDENYRKLVPIAYMNDFIRLHIATKLEGADGLYYLVRKELRYDQFQCTLEDISQKLDAIIDNQTQIYQEICDMNKKCNEIMTNVLTMAKTASNNSQKLDSIAENARISAYNSERIARENEYQSFLMTWKH